MRLLLWHDTHECYADLLLLLLVVFIAAAAPLRRTPCTLFFVNVAFFSAESFSHRLDVFLRDPEAGLWGKT